MERDTFIGIGFAPFYRHDAFMYLYDLQLSFHVFSEIVNNLSRKCEKVFIKLIYSKFWTVKSQKNSHIFIIQIISRTNHIIHGFVYRFPLQLIRWKRAEMSFEGEQATAH